MHNTAYIYIWYNAGEHTNKYPHTEQSRLNTTRQELPPCGMQIGDESKIYETYTGPCTRSPDETFWNRFYGNLAIRAFRAVLSERPKARVCTVVTYTQPLHFIGIMNHFRAAFETSFPAANEIFSFPVHL